MLVEVCHEPGATHADGQANQRSAARVCNSRASRSRFPALCTACAWHTALPRDIQRPFLARSTEAPSSCSLTYITNARAPHDISCLCAVRMSTSTPQRQSEVALKEQTLKGKPRCPVKLSQLRSTRKKKWSEEAVPVKYNISDNAGDASHLAAEWYEKVTGSEWNGAQMCCVRLSLGLEGHSAEWR